MDYLRRTHIALPDEFRGAFPGYSSLRIGLHHTPGWRPNPKNPMTSSGMAYFYLVPVHGTGSPWAYKEVGRAGIQGCTPRDVADKARALGRDTEFLNRTLGTYALQGISEFFMME